MNPQDSPEHRMASYLKKIATGPQLSQDLRREEARDGMTMILKDQVPHVQAAVFLIALRMKRETDEENFGLLEALREAGNWAVAAVTDLVDLAEPYDGFNRYLFPSTVLPAVLASCGLPAVIHGCEQLAPKFGLTHRQVLAAAGNRGDMLPEEAARRIADPAIGWAYLDQAVFCPSIYRLREIRRLIVKRPCLATLEKLCGPVRAQGQTHLVVGYVHRDYQRLLPKVARHVGYASAVVIRGVEGGVSLPLEKSSEVSFSFGEEADRVVCLDPKEAGISASIRAAPFPSGRIRGVPATVLSGTSEPTEKTAAAVLEADRGALRGEKGPLYDGLLLSAAALLYLLRRQESLGEAANTVRQAIDSGSAMEHFEKGILPAGSDGRQSTAT